MANTLAYCRTDIIMAVIFFDTGPSVKYPLNRFCYGKHSSLQQNRDDKKYDTGPRKYKISVKNTLAYCRTEIIKKFLIQVQVLNMC